MKIAAFIFSLYMASLSLYPCCAFEDCENEKVASMQLTGDHEDDEEDCGINCEGCCGSLTISVENSSFYLLPVNNPKVYTNFLHPYMPEVHLDFWRPPQLG